jgi:16S rRNA processing protein RimM
MTSRVRIGKIVGYHGLLGAVKVKTFQENPSWPASLKDVFFESGGKSRQLVIRKAKPKSPTQLLVEFEGYTSRTQVEQEIGCGELFANLADLPAPEPGEFWADDLIGLRVTDWITGEEYGTVHDLLTAGGSDFLEIRLARTGETVVVPFIDEFFPTVEPEAGRMTVKGLADFLRDSGGEEP